MIFFTDTLLPTITLISNNLAYLGQGMLLTLQITVIAIVVGIIWGTLLAMMRLSAIKPLSWFAAIYVNSFRSVPLVMVLLWFYLLVPAIIKKFLDLSPTTDIRLVSAMVAFALFEAAYYAEIIRAGFLGVSKGQTSASLALGMTSWQTMYLIVMPQAFRTMTPLLLTQGIVLFQDVTLVYALSLIDFFKAANIVGDNAGSSTLYSAMILFAGGVYFVLCLSASLLVNYFKKRTL